MHGDAKGNQCPGDPPAVAELALERQRLLEQPGGTLEVALRQSDHSEIRQATRDVAEVTHLPCSSNALLQVLACRLELAGREQEVAAGHQRHRMAEPVARLAGGVDALR